MLGIVVEIDDQLKHCLAVADARSYAIVFGNYAWNKAGILLDRVIQCYNWPEVERKIERIANS